MALKDMITEVANAMKSLGYRNVEDNVSRIRVKSIGLNRSLVEFGKAIIGIYDFSTHTFVD